MKYIREVVRAGALLWACGATAQTVLIPPALDASLPVTLTLQEGMHSFTGGAPTMSLGANGDVLGPTLIVHQGDAADWTVVNALPDSTTLHWHGMHVAAHNDGGPYTPIAPGATWNPEFTVLDPAGTFWYHPHLHHMTEHQVSMGVAGQIWVRDPVEQALDLPRTYGVDEFPIILQTKDFDAMGMVLAGTNADDIPLVNATAGGTLAVPASVVRLHLLNGASQRVFNLGFTDNLPFHLIATDGGLLPAPVERTRLRLSPGERAEVLVDCSGLEGTSFELLSFASELPSATYGAAQPGMGPGMVLTGYAGNPLNGADFPFMTLQVGPPGEVTSIPEVLDPSHVVPWTTGDVNRGFTFSPTVMGPNALNNPFVINGTPFAMDVINFEAQLGDIEVWQLTNNSPIGHPFHVHNTPFYLLDRNGVAPGPEEAGLKDVVFVPAMQSARIILQFNDFADPDMPYMYHCHMLVHEDGGMMGAFVVVDPAAGVQELTGGRGGVAVPNPASDAVRFTGFEGRVAVVDLCGIVVWEGLAQAAASGVACGEWASGVYVARDRAGRAVRFVVE
ncbi:MAG: multicopper oxidase family protein [Flavobacteriales bacterium]